MQSLQTKPDISVCNICKHPWTSHRLDVMAECSDCVGQLCGMRED
jgi:hypothetical protein